MIHRWQNTLLENYYQAGLKEYLLDRGYVWFGYFSDWGFLCFNANQKAAGNEYPIVLIDHESPDQQQAIYRNFEECLQKNTVEL